MKFSNILSVVSAIFISFGSTLPFLEHIPPATQDLATRDSPSGTSAQLSVIYLDREICFLHRFPSLTGPVEDICDLLIGQLVANEPDWNTRRSKFTCGVVDKFLYYYPDWNIIVVTDQSKDKWAFPPVSAGTGHLERTLPGPNTVYEIYWFPRGYSSWYSRESDGGYINWCTNGCIVSDNAGYIAYC